MTRSACTVLLAAAGLGAVPVTAEPARLDLFAGYSATQRSESSHDERFHGLEAAVQQRLSSRLSLTGDVAMHRARVVGIDVNQVSLMAGPRFDITRGEKVRLFARALGGLVRSKESLAFFDGDLGSRTNPGLLAGLGVDYALGSRLGLRLLAEYYGVDSELQWDSQPRASFGVSYRLR
jgi:hypothetical protein